MKRSRISDSFVNKNRRRLEAVNLLCKEKYPDYIEELKGISEGSKIDYWKVLLLNCPEIRSSRSGCSSIAIGGKGASVFHNEDGDNWERKKDFFLAKVSQLGRTYHSFVYPGELCGSSYCWNSEGLFFINDYVVPIREDISEIPRYFISRSLIDARTIEEAVNALKKNNEASGAHYYIGKGSRIISAETANDKVSIRTIDRLDYHTNHYTHRRFIGKAMASKNTFVRYDRIKELIGLDKDPMAILLDRKGKPDPVFASDKCELRTLSTVVFKPIKNKVLIYDNKKLEYSFDIRS
jgi:hypothetical protein